jgi:hypothetical protein
MNGPVARWHSATGRHVIDPTVNTSRLGGRGLCAPGGLRAAA